jgi:hypothetical protein
MTTVDVFPDAEALAGAVLRGDLACGVYSSIPKSPTFPLVTVFRIGGTPEERHRLDFASLQIDVWGTSKTEARDIAAEARSLLHGMEGQTYTLVGGDPDDAAVTGVSDTLGLTWLPDPETYRDRYIFGVGLYLHAL